MQDNLLELRHISKQYPGVLALNDVTLEIKKGETHAIVGENGAGKSTMIKILSGAIVPSEGTVVFEGQEYQSMDPQRSTALGISVIYQEFNLMDTLSVAENLYAGHLPTSRRLYDKQETERRAKEVFEYGRGDRRHSKGRRVVSGIYATGGNCKIFDKKCPTFDYG